MKHVDELDVNDLLVRAADEVGTADYGDRSFVKPMTVLLESIGAEEHLTKAGALNVQSRVLELLRNRLRVERDLTMHPEILAENVSDPIVIIGLPRTGTTKLHRLIAADPSFQALPLWFLLNPAPIAGSQADGPEPRIELARGKVAGLQQIPELFAGHPLEPEEADEEYHLLEMTFESLANMLIAPCSAYAKWWPQQPRQEAYVYLHRLLQYRQWQDGGRRGRPMILKTPAHLGNLDLIYATFPNATVVHCHRDPSAVLASILRLIELAYSFSSDAVDLPKLGKQILDFFSSEMTRNLLQRKLLGEGQVIIDVDFQQICDDPLGVVRNIYARHGCDLLPSSRALMISWLENNPQHKYGKYSYALEDYGLTRQVVAEAFSEYLKAFGPR